MVSRGVVLEGAWPPGKEVGRPCEATAASFSCLGDEGRAQEDDIASESAIQKSREGICVTNQRGVSGGARNSRSMQLAFLKVEVVGAVTCQQKKGRKKAGTQRPVSFASELLAGENWGESPLEDMHSAAGGGVAYDDLQRIVGEVVRYGLFGDDLPRGEGRRDCPWVWSVRRWVRYKGVMNVSSLWHSLDGKTTV